MNAGWYRLLIPVLLGGIASARAGEAPAGYGGKSLTVGVPLGMRSIGNPRQRRGHDRALFRPPSMNVVDETRYRIAAILIKKGDHGRAIRELRRVTTESPDPDAVSAAHLSIGNLYRLTGRDPGMAIDELEKVAGRYRLQALRAIVETHEELGELEEAFARLGAAVEESEGKASKVQFLSEMAELSQRHGLHERAIDILREITAMVSYEDAAEVPVPGYRSWASANLTAFTGASVTDRLKDFDVDQVVPGPAIGGLSVQIYTSRVVFEERLSSGVEAVNFDDVDTSAAETVKFAADRYRASTGIVVRGTDGQYASRSFDYPDVFTPTSSPNMYAPGPPATADSPVPRGGYQTDITFAVDDTKAAVAGFGLTFIDADYPWLGPSTLQVFDSDDRLIAQTTGCYGPDKAQLFRGLIAFDQEGNPTPAFFRVHVTNGNEWPSVNVGDGVALDDFVFSTPVPGGP